MDPGIMFIIMLGCTLFVIFEGAKAFLGVSCYHTKAHEAEQILNSRAFETEEIVRKKLAVYFHDLEQKIKIAILSFFFAYVMISLMLHMIAPGSPIWKSFGVVFVFYIGPLGIGLLATYEFHSLKKEITDKLNAC